MEFNLSSNKHSETDGIENPQENSDKPEIIQPSDDSQVKEPISSYSNMKSIDLNDYRKGRLFMEFPISGSTLSGLREKGFSLPTRSQSMFIERALANRICHIFIYVSHI